MTPRKLRILILMPIAPWPTHSGWATSFYHVLVTLKELGHELHLLATTDDPDADIATLRETCPTEFFYTPKPPRWRQVISNFGNRLPFSIARYRNEALLEAAKRCIARDQIDVVLIEDLAMEPYGPILRADCGVPYYIRTHNIDTQLFRRFAAEQRNPLMRLVAEWQKWKMLRFEGPALANADGYSVLSETDRDDLLRDYPDLVPDIVGNGTDLDLFRDMGEPRKPDLVSHVGTLTAHTKQEAMEWFCREAWPLVRAARPEAVLELVGFTPEGVFSDYQGVDVVGRVDDVAPYLAHGRVFIAPQFVGSGVRLKLLNAMATGNAIVCTKVACEGIPFVDGVHALIRDDARGFADAVLQVLADDEVARGLGRNAKELAFERFSWRAIVPVMEQRLYELAGV